MSDENNKINKKVEIDLSELLKNDAPYLVEDGKVNLEKLKGMLTGKTTEKEDDRFYFNWAGKDKVFQAIQAPAYSTLAPQKDKSIGWDETENLMIVGENLETLKLLLKPYFGKVKVIYIDPPYNTGKDFIYKDDFSAPLKDYLERTGQKGADGERLTTNSETNGRYHSDWLNFMYPRLFMARNLLKDDGVIFVSIDDNEVHHLRMIMDDIYGEDNFIESIIWKKRAGAPNDKVIGSVHEYVLIYAKDKSKTTLFLKDRTDKQLSRYKNPDNHPKGLWASDNLMANVKGGRYVASLSFPIVNPNTGEEHYPSSGGNWRFNKEKIEKLLENNEIYFGEDGKGRPKLKRFLDDVKEGVSYPTIWDFVPFNNSASREIEELLGNLNIFETPKPSGLIANIINLASQEDDIILDFFAGSGTTGHAVLALNKEQDRKRKFVLVQLDEKTTEGSEAKKAGFNDIGEICVARLKKVIEKISSNEGYKVFKLSTSNFNLKEEFELTENKDLGELKSSYLKELGLYVDQPTVATANTLDIVYEIILKNGFSLNSKIEELKLGSNNFYKASDTENELEIHISLDAKIEDNSVEAIRTTEYKGKTFAFYDNALTDSQKINLNTFVKLQVI